MSHSGAHRPRDCSHALPCANPLRQVPLHPFALTAHPFKTWNQARNPREAGPKCGFKTYAVSVSCRFEFPPRLLEQSHSHPVFLISQTLASGRHSGLKSL